MSAFDGSAFDTGPVDDGRARSAEVVVARMHRNARWLWLPAIVLVADAGALGYFAGRFTEQWQNWAVLAGAVLVFVLLVLVPYFGWLGRTVTITTRRVVVSEGLGVRHRRELLHAPGHDVTVRRSGLQLLSRSGDVLIHGASPEAFRLRDVPSATSVQRALTELNAASVNPLAARREQERLRRSGGADARPAGRAGSAATPSTARPTHPGG